MIRPLTIVRNSATLMCVLLANITSPAQSSAGLRPAVSQASGLPTNQIQLLHGDQPQHIFSGRAQTVSLLWRNRGETALELEIRYRLYQASSATAAIVEELPWKTLKLLPGQTVTESAEFTVPAVNAETRFLLQWLTSGNVVLGTSELLAYPPDLVKRLKPLCQDEPLGVFDPAGELRLILKTAAIEFLDLERQELPSFTGRLAILGPFATRDEMKAFSRSAVSDLAKRGAAIVWLQPPLPKGAELQPSFYTVPLGKGLVVIVQHDFLKDLSTSPQAQLKLIQLCSLAVRRTTTNDLPD